MRAVTPLSFPAWQNRSGEPSPLDVYLRSLAEAEWRGDAREESFYPCLRDLLLAHAETTGRKGAAVTVIPRKTAECLLDFQVWQGPHQVAGYVEAKRPGTDLDQAAKSPQVRRYLATFPNLILTDFSELRLYRNGQAAGRAVVGWGEDGRPVGADELARLLDDFFAFCAPSPRSYASLATALAGRARVLAARIEERLLREAAGEARTKLTGFFEAFRTFLLSGLTESQFADLYAQTVTYGLLAARWQAPESFDPHCAFENIPLGSGILREVFQYITLGSPPPEIDWIVGDIAGLLAGSSISGRRAWGAYEDPHRDPVHHFYETFLAAYDGELRARRGVYYTPLPVVSWIVRSVHWLLRTRFGLPGGLADPGVTLLDPAAGTMTFVAEACRVAVDAHRSTAGSGGVPALLRDHLLPHFQAFELMMAPYAIGHLKMSLFLEQHGYRLADGERVHLYLTDALSKDDPPQTNLPYVDALAQEAQAAARIKSEERIFVVLGNPPWSGTSANRGEWIQDLLKGHGGYYQVDGKPLKERNPKWLQDDYVKFLRFAQWKIDQNGEGIVAFVTNHGWLDNPTFRGMRQSLLRTFDEVFVLDLHGNRRKGERRPDGTPDDNVFDDIEQGVAITLLVKKPGLPKRILRADLWGNRLRKRHRLDNSSAETLAWTQLSPAASLLVASDAGLEEEYRRGLPLPEIFPIHGVGIVTGRDARVTGCDRAELREEVRLLRCALWRGGPIDPSWKLDAAGRDRARRDALWEQRFVPYLPRPFDRRWLFYADYLVERPREAMMRHLRSGGNLALIAPRQHKEEPGALVTDRLAGHKAVSAYDINYVFPLWRDPDGQSRIEGRVPNLVPGLVRRLAEVLGDEPSPEDVLGYVYAVLYSPAYRERYADLLRRDFPRIPLPGEREPFVRLAALGRELIGLHLLTDPRLGSSPMRFVGDGSQRLGKTRATLRHYRPEERRVYVNAEGLCFEGLEPAVWCYQIGGHQVLDRWLQSRAGRVLGLDEIRDFRHTAEALRLTLEAQRRIDER